MKRKIFFGTVWLLALVVSGAAQQTQTWTFVADGDFASVSVGGYQGTTWIQVYAYFFMNRTGTERGAGFLSVGGWSYDWLTNQQGWISGYGELPAGAITKDLNRGELAIDVDLATVPSFQLFSFGPWGTVVSLVARQTDLMAGFNSGVWVMTWKFPDAIVKEHWQGTWSPNSAVFDGSIVGFPVGPAAPGDSGATRSVSVQIFRTPR